MNDQLDFFSLMPTESWVYEVMQPALMSVIEANNVAASKLLLKEGKNYSSVWYDTQMAFRICCREDLSYFSISNQYSAHAPTELNDFITSKKRSEGFTNYLFTPTEDGIKAFIPFLASVFDQAIDSTQKEFDCCSRFEECSDAKRCTNPNVDIATGCGYRKIMKKGQIFYGKNRNI